MITHKHILLTSWPACVCKSVATNVIGWYSVVRRQQTRLRVMMRYLSWCMLGGLLACQSVSQSGTKATQPQTSTANSATADATTDAAIPLCKGTLARLSPTDLAPPTYRTGIGTVHLEVTTRKAEAQRWFDQGLNLLYGFWHLEAYRAFRQAIKIDSTCAMNYWGLALCQPGFASENNKEWIRAIDRAMRLRGHTRPLENALIEATATLTRQGPDAAFAQFQTMAQTFSDDADAVAMAAIFMRQANKDMKGPVGDAIKASLERAIKRYPNHIGLLHHYIHILELRPDFAQALPMARHMVSLAPNSPHLTHMPGHLYYLAGQYKQAAVAYHHARQQDEQYHRVTGIPRDANQNYLHNLHFLAVAEAEQGHYEQALEAANAYANTTLTTQTTDGGSLMLLYEGRILPALVNIRFRQWQKATEYLSVWINKADLPSVDSPNNNSLVTTYLQVMQAYCQGMMATEEGNLTTAQQQLNQLSMLMKQYTSVGSSQKGKMAFRSINETYDIMDIARLELTGWLANRESGGAGVAAPFNGQAFMEAMELEKAIAYDEPPRLMYPVAESLGILHFRRGEAVQARAAFQQALVRLPNSPLIRQYLTQIVTP